MGAERTLRVELGTPGRGLLDDLDGLDPGAVEREEFLNANAIALAADGEVAGDVLAAIVNGENLAFKVLKTGFVTFADAN